MDLIFHPTTISVLIHVAVVVSVHVRVIMKRPTQGVALAWLLLVTVLPLAGVVLYLLFGERRVGRRRAERRAALRTEVDHWLERVLAEEVADVDWSNSPEAERIHRLGLSTVRVPTLLGNDLELISDTQAILKAMIRDVDAAQRSVHMLFYIWFAGGTADEVVEALIRARQRGVRCRVLVDSLGSAKWWKTPMRNQLEAAGVEVLRALPTGLFRAIVSRNDLRMHRKIVVIDGELAYTGSMNLVDPRFFKADAGVGEWVDAMVRMRGPAVEPLLGTLLSDWQLETGEAVEHLIETSDLRPLTACGTSNVQVVPSGPGENETDDALLQMLLHMVYAARYEILITTPYFVPDGSMLRALCSAAARGVNVELIVPARVDSLLVRYASRSHFETLLAAGVSLQQFDGGLLHTKSITVDGELSMFGTVNLDMRSLWLNYEITLFVYDPEFGAALRELQLSYLDDCRALEATAWRARPARVRFIENTARLVSPLL